MHYIDCMSYWLLYPFPFTPKQKQKNKAKTKTKTNKKKTSLSISPHLFAVNPYHKILNTIEIEVI